MRHWRRERLFYSLCDIDVVKDKRMMYIYVKASGVLGKRTAITLLERGDHND